MKIQMVVALACLVMGVAQARDYMVQFIAVAQIPNTFGGLESEAEDVNNLGEIVGYATNGAGVPKAFLRQGLSTQFIGSPAPSHSSTASGINNYSEVVGTFSGTRGRPFYWSSGTGFVEMSHDVIPGASYNDHYWVGARAISDFGLIVGGAEHESGGNVPVDPCHYEVPVSWTNRFTDPKVIYCPTEFWGNNYALDVSIGGWIVGHEVASTNKGFRARNGGVGFVPRPPGFGTLDDVTAQGVNDFGAVAGTVRCRAIYWDGVSKASRSLGTLTTGDCSHGQEVNDQDFVTGYSTKLVNGWMRERAFIWHDDFGMYPLPVPSAYGAPAQANCRAEALNNLNAESVIRVVGYCEYAGYRRAVYWEVVIGHWQS